MKVFFDTELDAKLAILCYNTSQLPLDRRSNRMLVSQNGYRRNYLGQWTKTPVSQLNNSNHLVLVRCDECGSLYKTLWSNRNLRLAKGTPDYCASCCHKGSRNSQHGKDRHALAAHARQFMKQNPMKGKHHSPSTKAKMSKIKAEQIADGSFNILSNNRGQKSWHESLKTGERFFADSGLELFRMRQLDEDKNVARWTKRHGIKVPYFFGGIARYCVPDFLIEYVDGTKVVEEVKGRVTKIETVKSDAIQAWCSAQGLEYRFLTQKMLNNQGEYRKFLKGD